MQNNKIFYGFSLIVLALVVFYLGFKISNNASFHWGPNQIGFSSEKDLRSVDSMSIQSVTNLVIDCACDVTIIPSDENKVILAYDKKYFINKCELKDDQLKIDFEGLSNHFLSWSDAPELSVTVYSNKLSSILQNGVGNIESKGVLKVDELSLVNSGVGNMDLSIDTKKLTLRNEGVGNVSIKGTAEKVNMLNEGTGSIDAEELRSKNAIVVNSGIGSIDAFATDTIDMVNTGIGDIEYAGHAHVSKAHVEGTGSIDEK